MIKIRPDKVIEKGEVYPMFINFQNGYLKSDVEGVKSTMFTNPKTGKRTLVAEVGDMLYAGEEIYEEIGHKSIMVKNPDTGKVTLYHAGVISLKPVLEEPSEIPVKPVVTNNDLSKKFGSKKLNKILDHRERLKVSKEVVEQQMKHITSNITEGMLDLSTYTEHKSDDFYIPPINREATAVELVYDINKILTKEEYEQIFVELNTSSTKSEFHPIIQSVVDIKLSTQETVLAHYASALYRLYLATFKDIRLKKFAISHTSETLNKIILSHFTQVVNGKSFRRVRSFEYKDKALCYAIVLTLLLSNYKFEVDLLCNHLNIKPRGLMPKIKMTGACISTDKKYVVLKLPLAIASNFRRQSAKF